MLYCTYTNILLIGSKFNLMVAKSFPSKWFVNTFYDFNYRKRFVCTQTCLLIRTVGRSVTFTQIFCPSAVICEFKVFYFSPIEHAMYYIFDQSSLCLSFIQLKLISYRLFFGPFSFDLHFTLVLLGILVFSVNITHKRCVKFANVFHKTACE